MSSKTRKRSSEVRTLRSWLEKFEYTLPFPRPWYLDDQDVPDVMGHVWMKLLEKNLLSKEVPRSYLVTVVRNELYRRGLTQKFQGDAQPLLAAHSRQCQEHYDDDCSDELQRRINLRMAARHLQERHLRTLELSLEGYSSSEVSELLRRKHGWDVTAATVRQWHKRHINSFYRAQAAA